MSLNLTSVAKENLKLRWLKAAALSEQYPVPSAQALAEELARMEQLGRYAAAMGRGIQRITEAERRPLDGPACSIDEVFQVGLAEYRKAADPNTFLRLLTARTTRPTP